MQTDSGGGAACAAMRWAARHAVRGRGAGNRPAAHAVLVGWATDPRWWQYARLPLLGVLCAVAAALGLLAWRRRRQGRGAAAAPGLALVGYSAHRQPATEAPAQPRHEAPPDRCFAVLLQLMPILHEQPPRSLRGIAQPVSETLARELGVRVVLIGRVPRRGVGPQPGQAELHGTQRATADSRVGAVSQSD